MIKHILLWRFQDAVREDPAQAQEILQKLFTDQASLDSYQNHPLHVAHKQMAAPYLAARLAADYQV